MATVSPSQEEKAKGIVPVLACVLHQLCTANDELAVDPKKAVSKFHALCIPALGIRGYLERIAKYSGCSPECFVLALVYIDRIIQSRGFIVNSYSIHRLLITGVMLAAKFFDDHYYNNAFYAKVGGVVCEEMNSLEVEFLFMLNFHLFVSTRTYKLYYQELYAHSKNAKSTCGCSTANVPILVLPFPEDEKSITKDMLKPQESDSTPTTAMQTTSTTITSSASSSTDVSPTEPLSDPEPEPEPEGELDDEGDEMEDVVYTDDSKKEESIPSSLPPSRTLTASASQQHLVSQAQQKFQQQQLQLQLQMQQQMQQQQQQPKFQVQVSGIDNKPSLDQTPSTHRRAPSSGGITRSQSSGLGSSLTSNHRKAKSDIGLTHDFDRSSLLQSPKPKVAYPGPDPRSSGSTMPDSVMTTDGLSSHTDLGTKNFRRAQSGTDLSGLRSSRSDTSLIGSIPVGSIPVGSTPRSTGKKWTLRQQSAVAVR